MQVPITLSSTLYRTTKLEREKYGSCDRTKKERISYYAIESNLWESYWGRVLCNEEVCVYIDQAWEAIPWENYENIAQTYVNKSFLASVFKDRFTSSITKFW